FINVGIWREFEREIDLRFAPFEPGWHHANDLVGLVNELNRAAYDVGVAPVIALPKFVSNGHDRLRILTVGSVRWDEPAAHHRGATRMAGSVGGDVGSLDIFGEIAVGGGEVPSVEPGYAFDRLGLPNLFDLRTSEPGIAVVAGRVEQTGLHDALGAGIG